MPAPAISDTPCRLHENCLSLVSCSNPVRVIVILRVRRSRTHAPTRFSPVLRPSLQVKSCLYGTCPTFPCTQREKATSVCSLAYASRRLHDPPSSLTISDLYPTLTEWCSFWFKTCISWVCGVKVACGYCSLALQRKCSVIVTAEEGEDRHCRQWVVGYFLL